MSRRKIPRYQRDAANRHEKTRIIADLSKQAPNNSYDPPRYYEDRDFTCVDCGKEETWTAEQQQWWYEVAQGSIYSGAIRCRECRQLHRTISHSNLPQHFQSGLGILKYIQLQIQPALDQAGFVFRGRQGGGDPRVRVSLEFEYSGELLSLAFEPAHVGPARLIAELLREDSSCDTIVVKEDSLTHSLIALKSWADTFATTVQQWLIASRD